MSLRYTGRTIGRERRPASVRRGALEEKMSPSRSFRNVAANTGLPSIFAYGQTADGLALQLRSDPAGVLDVPELQSVLVAIHVGAAAKISCRRGGESHTGSAVHGDIDIIPARIDARWEI